MGKVTSKLQATIPKVIADRYGIRPGTEIEWMPAGDSIRVFPGNARPAALDVDRRLELFDQATRRQSSRPAGKSEAPAAGRGWTREDLYGRAGAR